MPSVKSSFDPCDSSDVTGPMQTEGYVCPSQGAPFELTEVTLPSLAPTMVETKILMVGLCHTDIHMRDNDWGTSDYPLLAGHEAVAEVVRIGDAVSSVQVGDRVAIAWIRDSCASCESCEDGRENICREGYQGTYLGKASGVWGSSPLEYNRHGGCFVRVQRVEERFAVKIPEGVPSEIACPLLCGGGTMFEPICDYGGEDVKVGIVGIGGLGTAGIKLARLKGCVVYALSGSAWKREGALAVGANEFVDLKVQKEVDSIKGVLDVILDTTPTGGDISQFMDLLKFDGVFVRVGIPGVKVHKFEYGFIPLIFTQRKIAGSIVTGTRRTKEMLQLVERNLEFMTDGDSWKTEVCDMSEINESMHRLENRTNKGYRYVLKW